MHDDTAHLVTLWTAEQAVDALLAERAGLDTAIVQAEHVLAQANDKVKHIEAEQAQLQEQEHAHSRKLHTYTKKRDDTRHLIDTGATSDYLVAESQYQKCAAIADEVETALLDIMEKQDETKARHSGSIDIRDLKQHNLQEVQSAKTGRLPSLEQELEAASIVRDAARTPVPKHLMGRYDLLREKGLSCVSTVKDAACTACRIAVNRTMLAEHKRGAKVHHCTNCGRFLGEIV